MSTFEVQTLVLGLCYSFWDDGDQAATAQDVFSAYSGRDLGYVAIALSLGGLFCGLLQVLHMHLAPSGVSAVLTLGAVLYLNVAKCCYSAGGRWGEGLLWTVLLQLLVLETIKAAGLFLLARRRVLTS